MGCRLCVWKLVLPMALGSLGLAERRFLCRGSRCQQQETEGGQSVRRAGSVHSQAGSTLWVMREHRIMALQVLKM